jgi:hypothetical protein
MEPFESENRGLGGFRFGIDLWGLYPLHSESGFHGFCKKSLEIG